MGLEKVDPALLLEQLTNAPKPTNEPICIYCNAMFPFRMTERGPANVCLECKEKFLKPVYHGSGFPARYQAAKIGNHSPLVDTWIKGGSNLILLGPAGTGKTYLACSAALMAQRNSYFWSVPEVLLDFQGAVKEHEEMERIRGYLRANDSQIFDDVGAHRVSDFSLEMFGILMEKFYANDYTGLIFTSNLKKRDILDTMGERIASRLFGLGPTTYLEGTDRRLNNP